MPEAEVELIGAAPDRLTFDVVRTTTDARGRAQPALLVGRLYTATALGRPAADGSRDATEIVMRVAAGQVRELPAWFRTAPRAVTFEVDPSRTDEWRRGVHLLDSRSSSTLRVPVAANGTATLPAGPFAAWRVAVADAAGNHTEVWPWPATAAAATLKLEAKTAVWVRLRDEHDRPLSGMPIALARLPEFDDGSTCRNVVALVQSKPLAHTDEYGDADVPLAWTDRRQSWLVVGDRPPVQASRAAARVLERPLAIVVSPAMPTQSTLRGARSGESVHACLRVGLDMFTKPIPVACIGTTLRAAVTQPAGTLQLSIHLLPIDKDAVPRCAILPSSRTAMLQDVDLDTLRRVPVRITNANGNPGAGAEIVVIEAPPQRPGIRSHTTTVFADPAGRAELLLGSGHWGVYVRDENAHCWTFLLDDSPAEPLSIRLAPFPVVQCRVVDSEGNPVPGAHVTIRARDGGTGRKGTEGLAKDALARAIVWRAAEFARSGRDGVLRVPILDWGEWRVQLAVVHGPRSSTSFPALAGDDVGDIVVR